MKWSATLGRFAGIDVKVHATFLLLLAWVAWVSWQSSQSTAATLEGVVFILALFVCVVLHEFGHALTARRYGVETRDIILLPIGGVARLEEIPDNPRQELWIALAGPAVNVVIAGVLASWLTLTGWQAPEALAANGGTFLERLVLVNVFLVIFNLLPAFPMDGGRILRALLGLRLEYVQATRIAARIGQLMAVGFGFLALLGNPFLLLIAVFVWIGAAREARMVRMKHALSEVPVGEVIITDYRSLTPSDHLGRAVELTLTGSQADFPVIEEGRLVGILRQKDLVEALGKHGFGLSVREVMQRQFPTATLSEMLAPVFVRLQKYAGEIVPVFADRRLAGLVTRDNIGEFLSFQAALRR